MSKPEFQKPENPIKWRKTEYQNQDQSRNSESFEPETDHKKKENRKTKRTGKPPQKIPNEPVMNI